MLICFSVSFCVVPLIFSGVAGFSILGSARSLLSACCWVVGAASLTTSSFLGVVGVGGVCVVISGSSFGVWTSFLLWWKKSFIFVFTFFIILTHPFFCSSSFFLVFISI